MAAEHVLHKQLQLPYMEVASNPQPKLDVDEPQHKEPNKDVSEWLQKACSIPPTEAAAYAAALATDGFDSVQVMRLST